MSTASLVGEQFCVTVTVTEVVVVVVMVMMMLIMLMMMMMMMERRMTTVMMGVVWGFPADNDWSVKKFA